MLQMATSGGEGGLASLAIVTRCSRRQVLRNAGGAGAACGQGRQAT